MTGIAPRHFAPSSLIWAELTRAELATKRDAGALVVVPTGAIEQHGDFLPVETDTFLASAVAELAASRVAGVEIVVAPAVPVGFSPHHLSHPGTISLRLETYLAVLADTVRSILDAGFPRVVFVNGHGGNSAPLRSLCAQMVTDGYAVGMVDYFAPGEKDWLPFLKGGLPRTGHACEQEVALTMALMSSQARERVQSAIEGLPARLVQPWIAPGHVDDPITAFGAGWPPIFQADDCGYFGDPAKATVENGILILEATVKGLAACLEAFARTPLRLGIARDPASPRLASEIPGRK
ncbi:creatininase family protein [Neorhizobium galegae]|uniref:creatininase family protein n=1 Tax=Neorhizobium galegae TaxID=399 RepID=UPI0027D7E5D1|nr:creatininase family protein [Neorhizobium galegae]